MVKFSFVAFVFLLFFNLYVTKHLGTVFLVRASLSLCVCVALCLDHCFFFFIHFSSMVFAVYSTFYMLELVSVLLAFVIVVLLPLGCMAYYIIIIAETVFERKTLDNFSRLMIILHQIQ